VLVTVHPLIELMFEHYQDRLTPTNPHAPSVDNNPSFQAGPWISPRPRSSALEMICAGEGQRWRRTSTDAA
jgi:hypothetical protein